MYVCAPALTVQVFLSGRSISITTRLRLRAGHRQIDIDVYKHWMSICTRALWRPGLASNDMYAKQRLPPHRTADVTAAAARAPKFLSTGVLHILFFRPARHAATHSGTGRKPWTTH
jgi:hypothetical protein